LSTLEQRQTSAGADANGAGPAGSRHHHLRLAIFTDHLFWREGDDAYSDKAFPMFAASMASMFDRLVFVARVNPVPGRSHYRLPSEVELEPLPWVANLSHARDVAWLTARSLRRFWRILDDVDVVWLVGSYAVSLPFAMMAAARGKRVAFGIRQDLPSYARGRHPTRRWIHAGADLLDAAYRAVTRIYPVVVVGPDLARRYRKARSLLDLSVSMISERDIVPLEQALERPWGGDLTILNVGRIEMEKNPLLLADVLARLRADDPRWRLVVCGDGPMEDELADRLRSLDLADSADLRGYVTLDKGLLDAYRSSNAFLHVSWTEGLPQIMFEAFSAGLPVVATAVGGVPDGVGDAALLIPPGDPVAAVEALERLAGDEALRAGLIRKGLERARAHTTESECRRLADFLAGAG
jgi:glycosyltransferase involved in cell wall biosynthesis